MSTNLISSNLHLVEAAAELLEIVNINPHNPVDIDETVHKIAVAALRIAEAQFCAITVINPITYSFIYSGVLTSEMSSDTSLIQEPIQASRFLQSILENEAPFLFIEDIENSKQYDDPFKHYGPSKATAILKLLTPRKSPPMPLAILHLGYKESHSFSSMEERFFRLLANQAASVLQHTWSLRRYSEVARIGQEINQDLISVEAIFEKLQLHAPGILDINYIFALCEYLQGSNKLNFYYIEEGIYKKEPNRSFRGACKWVIQNKKSLLINDYENEINKLKNKGIKIIHLKNTKDIIPASMIFMPLMIRDTAIGVLSIQNTRPFAFDNEDLKIMELLAHHVSLALSNLRLKTNLENLNETGQALTQKLDTENILQEVIDLIQNVTKADVVSLYPYDTTNELFQFPVLYSGKLLEPDFPTPNYSRPDDMATMTLKHGEPVFAEESRRLYTMLGGDNTERRGKFEIREKIRSTVTLPLLVGNQQVGVLFLNFRQPQQFSEVRQQFISGLANYAAIAIKNSRTFGNVSRRRIKELEALRKIDRAINSTLELEELMKIILDEAEKRLRLSLKDKLNGSILLYNQADSLLRVGTAIGPNSKKRLGQTIDLKNKKGFTFQVMETKAPVRVGNVKSPQWKELYYEVDSTTFSELDVPLLDENEDVIGIISFESERIDRFTQEDQQFLTTLANQGVLAIKKARAYEREKQLLEAQTAIQEIEREIISNLDFKQVATLILDKALELTKSHNGVLFLYDQAQEDLYAAEGRGVIKERQGERMSLEQGLTGWAIRNKQILNADIRSEEWKDLNEDWIKGSNWSLAVPMLKGRDKDLVGAITLESKTAFNEQDERLLMGLADLAIIAVENATIYRLVEESLNRFQELYEVGKLLGEITDPNEIEKAYSIVVDVVAKQPDVQGVVRRFKPETQDLVLVWTAKKLGHQPFERININEDGINAVAARTRKFIKVDDTDNPPQGIKPNLSDENTHSLVVAIIEFADKYYGNLSLSHPQKHFFAEIDSKLIQGLAQLLGLTIYRLNAEKDARALEAIGSIGQVAYELAHRIGNDLGWILLDFDVPLKKPITEVVEKKLERVIVNVNKVIKLSRKIKQVISAPSNRKELLSIEDLTSEIRDLLSPVPDIIDFNWVVEESNSKVYVDKTQITSIVQNIVSNAVEELSEGGKILVQVSEIGDWVGIKVLDNGNGIPPDLLPRIFDFLVSSKESSGFGLWSAMQYTILHKGQLTAESEIGKGTTFTLLLQKVKND